jgi:hypothetical protein
MSLHEDLKTHFIFRTVASAPHKIEEVLIASKIENAHHKRYAWQVFLRCYALYLDDTLCKWCENLDSLLSMERAGLLQVFKDDLLKLKKRCESAMYDDFGRSVDGLTAEKIMLRIHDVTQSLRDERNQKIELISHEASLSEHNFLFVVRVLDILGYEFEMLLKNGIARRFALLNGFMSVISFGVEKPTLNLEQIEHDLKQGMTMKEVEPFLNRVQSLLENSEFERDVVLIRSHHLQFLTMPHDEAETSLHLAKMVSVVLNLFETIKLKNEGNY